MKKIFIMLVAFTSFGCVPQDSYKPLPKGKAEVIERMRPTQVGFCEYYIMRVQYEGHCYIIFKSRAYGNGGAVHDPECPCAIK